MLKDLVAKCRTYRRFYEEEKLSVEDLKDIVDTARLTGSTANTQALKFRIVTKEEETKKVFDALWWAGALSDWEGPDEGERPSAYILIVCDLGIAKNKLIDDGIAAQTMMLAAAEKGYGGCIIGNFKRSVVADVLGIDQSEYSLDLILALGKPKEQVKIVPIGEDKSTTYYRDENQVHYVPKRSLDELLI